MNASIILKQVYVNAHAVTNLPDIQHGSSKTVDHAEHIYGYTYT